MAILNEVTNEILLKVVYIGCAGSGKTTNIQSIYKQTSGELSSRFFDLHKVRTPTPYFDFLPISLGEVHAQPIRLHLYTLPGIPMWPTLTRQILSGCDGLVWVVDSRSDFLERNEIQMQAMQNRLAEVQINLDEVPLVIQFNHRDSSSALSITALRNAFGRSHAQVVESVAVQDIGVMEAVEVVSEQILQSMEVLPDPIRAPGEFPDTRDPQGETHPILV
jgi:signal recognition particle receptor subunit beta